jgi:hypothetical protein
LIVLEWLTFRPVTNAAVAFCSVSRSRGGAAKAAAAANERLAANASVRA